MDHYEGVGIVSCGKLGFDRERLAAAVRLMPEGVVTIRVERRRATRSTKANAYYWSGPIASIAEYTGFTPDETHELMKAMHLPKRLAAEGLNGEIVADMVVGGTTTSLDSAAFADYIARIKAWAFDKLGVVVPEPDEVL